MNLTKEDADKLPVPTLVELVKAITAMHSEEAFKVFDIAMNVLSEPNKMSGEEFIALTGELDIMILESPQLPEDEVTEMVVASEMDRINSILGRQ